VSAPFSPEKMQLDQIHKFCVAPMMEIPDCMKNTSTANDLGGVSFVM
jgi:hypothetical protein